MTLQPCSRRELVRKLKSLGYEGPFAGGKHQYMIRKGSPPVRIPNPHRGDIGIDLLKRILRAASIDEDAWNRA